MPRPFKQELSDEKLRYHRQRCQARYRGEPWSEEFTFERWWEIWQPLWPQRGRRADQLTMVRQQTDRAWHQDNVEIRVRRQWLSEMSRQKTTLRWQQLREAVQS